MYVRIPFWPFLLSMLIVAIPLAILERGGDDRAADLYLALIILMMVVTNFRGVRAFSDFVSAEVQAGG